MKASILLRQFTFSGLFLLAGIAFASGSLSEYNKKDDQGRKQGFWQIKGYMGNDPSYGAENIVEEGTYVDDKKEGLWKKYYPTGTLKSEITYINNRPNGPYSVFYPSGQLEEKGNWSRNKNTGEFNRFYKNGEPQQEFFFDDTGLRNGVQRYFHENGQLSLEVNIIDGKEAGVMKRFDESGKLIEEKSMNAGQLVAGSIKRYDKPSKDEPKIEIAKDAKTTTTTSDKTNSAHQFQANGFNTLYDKNQQLSQVGEFKNGRLWDGKWHRYDSNGILQRIEIYKNGRYVGDGVLEEQE